MAEAQTEAATPLALPEGTSTAPAAEVAPADPAAAATVAPVVTAPAVPAAPVAPVAPTPAVTAPAAPAAPVATVVAPATPVAGSGQVRIQFVADCWTQVKDGSGKVLFSGLKRKGDSVDVSGKPPFAVRLGFARGAQVSYNGQAVDVPFTNGATATFTLGQ